MHQSMQTESRNKMLLLQSKMTFDRYQNNSMNKAQSFQQMVMKQMDIHMLKNELRPFTHTRYKNELRLFSHTIYKN